MPLTDAGLLAAPRCAQGLRPAHDLVDDAADVVLRRPALPVALDRLELVEDALLPALDLEWPAAGGVGREPLLAHVARLLVRHDLLSIHHVPPRQERQERRVGLREVE